MTSHSLNVLTERLEMLFWTSRLGLVSRPSLQCLGLVSVSRLWRLGLVSVSASHISFTTLLCAEVTTHHNITFELHFNDNQIQMQTVDKTVISGPCWSVGLWPVRAANYWRWRLQSNRCFTTCFASYSFSVSHFSDYPYPGTIITGDDFRRWRLV